MKVGFQIKKQRGPDQFSGYRPNVHIIVNLIQRVPLFEASYLWLDRRDEKVSPVLRGWKRRPGCLVSRTSGTWMLPGKCRSWRRFRCNDASTTSVQMRQPTLKSASISRLLKADFSAPFAELKVFIQGFSFRTFSIRIKRSPSIQSQTHCKSVTNLDPGSWGERPRRVRIPYGFKLISGVVWEPQLVNGSVCGQRYFKVKTRRSKIRFLWYCLKLKT